MKNPLYTLAVSERQARSETGDPYRIHVGIQAGVYD